MTRKIHGGDEVIQVNQQTVVSTQHLLYLTPVTHTTPPIDYSAIEGLRLSTAHTFT